MFGKEYSKAPEILLSSFGQMHSKYKRIGKKNKNSVVFFLQKLYINLFGIPEIGFQIRSLYFKEILGKKLKGKKIKKILDAGSGIGMYTFWLARNYPKAQVVGGDIDKEKLAFCSEFAKKINSPNIYFQYFDVTRKYGKKEKIDLIVNIDVLEHINNYKSVIRNFSKMLSDRGYLFLHTPQPNQKRIFKSLKKWYHEEHLHEGYTPEELKSELKKMGFKIIEIRETFGFFGKLAWELNHISLRQGFIFSGIVYPFLYLIANMDLMTNNKGGLCTAILAQKK